MDTTKNKYYKPTSTEINEIINSTVPENTQLATAKWVKILGNWQHDVEYNYRIETVMDKDQLENEMTKFSWDSTSQHDGKHYNMLTEQFEFTSNGGIHFKKYSQKNDQGGVDGNSNALIVPVPPDSEGSQGPIYDIKFYFSKRPSNSKCPYLYLKINKNINRVAMGTTMSITGHKSKSSYRIYARPSNNQKEEAISLLIDSVGTLPSNSQESEDNAKERYYGFEMGNFEIYYSTLNPNLTKPFRQPLRKTTTMNLLLHINAMKRNPTIGRKQNIRKPSHEDEEDNFSEDTA
ncbi:44760_t:CDS:2, partial [Gigaspora margarita]